MKLDITQSGNLDQYFIRFKTLTTYDTEYPIRNGIIDPHDSNFAILQSPRGFDLIDNTRSQMLSF